MADPIAEQIEKMASSPSAVTGDSGSITERPLTELIEARRDLAAAELEGGINPQGGPRSGWGGLRMAKAQLPGAS